MKWQKRKAARTRVWATVSGEEDQKEEKELKTLQKLTRKAWTGRVGSWGLAQRGAGASGMDRARGKNKKVQEYLSAVPMARLCRKGVGRILHP